MPRQPRLELPGIPMHVTQRGVNRCAIFIDEQDRHHYRRLLREACRKHGVAVHAFVLMDNHVHLLLSANLVGQIALAMRATGQSHVQAFNFRHGRSGTLWQGRFKSCLVETGLAVGSDRARPALGDGPVSHLGWARWLADVGPGDRLPDPLLGWQL
jgi:putative transposase